MCLLIVHGLMIAHIAHWNSTGSTITPLEPSEAMQALELGYVNAGIVFFALAILVTAIMGRFFCGWGCHVVAYQDASNWILKKLGLRPRPVRARLLWLIPFGIAFYMFVYPQLVRWSDARDFPILQAHFTTDKFWETFPGPIIAALTFVVDGFLIVYFLGSKGFCTYGCPYGAFFGIADKVAPGRIRVNENCEQCGHCTATCTSNVQVHREVALYGMVVDSGCMKCLDCVSVCPKNALSFGLGNPWKAQHGKAAKSKTTGKKKAPKSYDFSWTEEIVMGVLFFFGLYAFRLLYNKVSFFLAIGLAVFTAVSAILLFRLLRSTHFRLQNHTLKSQGKITRGGWIGLLVLGSYVLFSLHSGWLQYHAKEGERLLKEAGASASPPKALLDSSLAHLNKVASFSAFPWGSVKNQMGEIYLAQGKKQDAERYYREAISDDSNLIAPRLRLSTLLYLRGDAGGAALFLNEILEIDPANQEAFDRLEKLHQRHGKGS